MYFQQFFLSCLAHASYFIGSDGVAAVIDPQRDVDLYVKEAQEHGFQIAYVIETHLHADFVSGHQELAARTGAKIYLGAKSRATFPHVDVRDGDEIKLGKCKLRFLETPGHTLESISIVALDETNKPYCVLTGDTLFIGDVGRPDLGGDPKELAALLYDSLHEKLLTLPDYVTVFPAHGAGSLCGRSMSTDRSSTIGREKKTNYALKAADKATFIEMLTAELPDRPGYFAADVEINRSGAPPLGEMKPLPKLSPDKVVAAQDGGAIVLDTRDEDAFGAAHIPGAVNIGLDGQFASWAGTILGLHSDIIILADDDEKVHEARTRLARVGVERVVGSVEGGMQGWYAAKMPVQSIPQLSPSEFAAAIAGERMQVLDVRRDPEWDGGHIPGAQHVPLGNLVLSLGTLAHDRPLAVHCKSGYRSSIATSLLQRAGFTDLVNLRGGYDAWQDAGLEAPAAV